MPTQLTLVHTLPLEVPGAVLAKMWRQVDDGVRLLPKRGAEIGGLLVGPKSHESGLVVDELVALPIEYKLGPSFRISESDGVKLAELIESVQSDAGKAVVGFYRSQTRGDEALRESDREICSAIEKIHTSFAEDFQCYFVLAPVSRAEKLAYVSLRNGSDWDTTEYMVRASSLPSVAPMPTPPPEPKARRQAAEPIFDYTEPKLNSSWQPTRRLYRGLGILAGSALLAAMASGGVHWYQSMLQQRAEAAAKEAAAERASLPPLRMGFAADRQGDMWKLSWDRGTMEVLKPGGGLLVIQDGETMKQIRLMPADLSSGTIFYTSHGGDLNFSLRLDSAGGAPLEEHVRVLEGPPSVPQPTEPAPAAAPKRSTRTPAAVVSPPGDPANLDTPPDLVP
jgi:hypothetical protein